MCWATVTVTSLAALAYGGVLNVYYHVSFFQLATLHSSNHSYSVCVCLCVCRRFFPPPRSRQKNFQPPAGATSQTIHCPCASASMSRRSPAKKTFQKHPASQPEPPTRRPDQLRPQADVVPVPSGRLWPRPT